MHPSCDSKHYSLWQHYQSQAFNCHQYLWNRACVSISRLFHWYDQYYHWTAWGNSCLCWQCTRQFGNVLVLATTYKSKSLGQLVSKTQLAQLFERTINFLRSHSSISATLAEDAKILELVRRIVFMEEDWSNSFSSVDFNWTDTSFIPRACRTLAAVLR